MDVRFRPFDAALRAAFSSAAMVLLLAACDAAPAGGDAAADPAAPALPAGPATADPPALGAPRSIGSVQGRGERSPYEGQTVSLRGVITGNFVSGLGGFFLQDASGAEDGDRATSDALWVQPRRNGMPKLRRGDRVSVLGRVAELGDGPETLTSVLDAEVEVIGRAAVSITEIADAPADAAAREALEGMWLRVTAPLTVVGNDGLLRFGELRVAFGGDLRVPTDQHPPGPKAQAQAARNGLRRLVLDDNRDREFPDRLWYLPEPLSVEAPLRAGSRLHGVEGILDLRHGQWRLQATGEIARIEQAPRPPAPVLAEGLRLGSFNVLNLFNGNGRGGGFPTERGAPTRAEYLRQRAKTVAMLVELRPDIAALMEIENDGFDRYSTLSGLLDALNAAIEQAGGQGDYAAVEGGDPGAGPIRVALIYRRSQAQPIGRAAGADPALFEGARPPLAQTFRVAGGARQITVVANHLKSKGGCRPDPAVPGDADLGDGQGCWNATRVELARALDTWLRGNPTGVDTPNRVLLGDFNAYTQEDPLRLLRSLGWSEARIKRDEPAAEHSYRWNGERGSLDHALLSPSLTGALRDVAHWATNSEESEAFDYHLEHRRRDWYRPDPYAASDHNPLLIVLDPLRAAP